MLVEIRGGEKGARVWWRGAKTKMMICLVLRNYVLLCNLFENKFCSSTFWNQIKLWNWIDIRTDYHTCTPQWIQAINDVGIPLTMCKIVTFWNAFIYFVLSHDKWQYKCAFHSVKCCFQASTGCFGHSHDWMLFMIRSQANKLWTSGTLLPPNKHFKKETAFWSWSCCRHLCSLPFKSMLPNQFN